MDDYMQRLKTIAFKTTEPFCYGCYEVAPTGRCAICGSDDLMRHLKDVGVEHGTDWVIQHLVGENLSFADTASAFEDSVNQCYPETVTIGWITYDTVSAIQELDPISWRMAESEWIDQEVDAENLVTFDGGSTYYWKHELEQYLDKVEQELDRL